MLIETKIADSRKLNFYYHFETTDKKINRMELMFDNKDFEKIVKLPFPMAIGLNVVLMESV